MLEFRARFNKNDRKKLYLQYNEYEIPKQCWGPAVYKPNEPTTIYGNLGKMVVYGLESKVEEKFHSYNPDTRLHLLSIVLREAQNSYVKITYIPFSDSEKTSTT